MKIAFIITSFWAYGELLIAMQFAKELRISGNDIMFIVPPTHKDNMIRSDFRFLSLVPKSQKFNRILFVEVRQKFTPDLVILSDFLNYSFAEKHYGLVREDLDLLGGKLATFDNFDWALERKCMDTYGFASTIPHRTNVIDYGARILPCPLADYQNKAQTGGHRYALTSGSLKVSDTVKKNLRRKHGFGTKESDKIILISNAKWQESHIEDKKVTEFINLSNRYFDQLVIRLSVYYKIICIGNEDDRFQDNKNIYVYPSMPSQLFDEFAAMSDAYIGRNLTSTSMIRLALSDVLCFNMMSSIVSRDRITQKQLGSLDYEAAIDRISLYKYLMFPVGWYYFLKPLFAENEYGDMICMLEQFQLQESADKICSLLSSKDKQSEVFQKAHLLNKELAKLPTPAQIVDAIVS